MNHQDYPRDAQFRDLEGHFNGCLRYWQKVLKENADLDREPYLRAIDDIPHYNPFLVNGQPFDEEVLRAFKKARLMDAYGVRWEEHWDEHATFIKKEDQK